MLQKASERYQNLSEVEKEKNINIVAYGLKPFLSMKSESWLSIDIFSNLFQNVFLILARPQICLGYKSCHTIKLFWSTRLKYLQAIKIPSICGGDLAPANSDLSKL